MPHNIGCFIKWFYLILILQALCLRCLECRQQQNKHKNGNNNNNNNNNNNHNRQQSSYSNEQQNSDLYDSIENDSSSNSGVFNSHAHGYSHVNGHGHGHGNRRGSGGGGGGGGVGGARKKHHNNRNNNHNRQMDDNDLSLWINEQQLKILSELFFPPGYTGRIYAIENGHVLNDIRDMSIYKFLVIPSEVNYVNFTWKSGTRKYSYHFDRLQTLDDSILKAPTLSIKTKGRIPQDEKNFSIFLPCSGNNSGTAMFNVGLSIENRRGKPLPGTPIRLNFKKECAHRGVYDSLDASNPTSLTTSQGPDPECNLKCGNNGFCNGHKICQCKVGYTGQYCQTAFCFPQCMNGGNCTAPSVCTCPDGYQGTQCEGGICTEKCLNGGKCVQKDKCQCSKGYYGLRCEYSKCVIPCKNGGRCIGNNVCRCPEGLRGNHCEIGRRERSACKCKNGICLPNRKCKCDPGFYGRRCHRRNKRHPQITSYR